MGGTAAAPQPSSLTVTHSRKMTRCGPIDAYFCPVSQGLQSTRFRRALGAVDAGVHLPAWGKQEPRAGTLWAALRLSACVWPGGFVRKKNGRRVAAVRPARARFVYSSVCNSHLLTHLKGAAC